jgi:hypothetical protein
VLDYDLEKTLNWCVNNEVSFTVTTEDGLVAITAQRQNISASYVIEYPYDAKKLGEAVWACLFSVKHGTEFHAVHGDFPDPRALGRGVDSEGNVLGPIGRPASPGPEPAVSQSPTSCIPDNGPES